MIFLKTAHKEEKDVRDGNFVTDLLALLLACNCKFVFTEL